VDTIYVGLGKTVCLDPVLTSSLLVAPSAASF